MKLSVERNPGSIVVLDITADDAEYAEAMNAAFRKVSKDVQIPGFRKGKAPRGMIERMYGPDVFAREAADEIMEKLYRQALQQEELVPVGDPDVEIKDLQPVNFVVTVAVYPKLELGDYSGIRVDPIDAAVSDGEIAEVLERLQRSQSPWVDPKEDRKPHDGDQVTVDYEVLAGDEPFQEPITDALFILGETNLLAPLKDKLTELSVDETDSFDIAFDEEDQTADASIRGKTLTYKVTLKGLKEREILPLDDEFAQAVADASTLEELREQIREDIHQGKTSDGRSNVVNQIVEQLGNVSTLDLPQAMVHDELHHQLEHIKQDVTRNGTPFEAYLQSQGQNEQQLHDSLWPEAEKRLRSSMLLREFATQENVEVTADDLDAEVDKLIASNPGTSTGEGVEAQASRLREIYKSDYFRNMLQNELFDRKLTDRLIEIATEGKGAVLNPYVAPVVSLDDADDGIIDAEIVSDSSVDAASASSPIESTGEAAAAEDNTFDSEIKSAGPAESEGTDWVAASDAPEGWLIKGNADSGIYHTPESRSYNQTIAEVWFPTAEAAERAGYRAPRSARHTGEETADATSSAAATAARAIDEES